MTSLPDIGSVIVTVENHSGTRRTVGVRSTRGPMVSKLFWGRKADTKLSNFIGLVYTLCPVSQASAWNCAVAYARGESPQGAQQESWAEAVQLEILAEHIRCLAMDLPQQLGLPPPGNLRPLGAYRAKVSALALGAKEKNPRNLLREASALAGDLLFGEDPGQLPADLYEPARFASWVSTRTTALKPVFSYLHALPSGLGGNSVQALHPDDPDTREELAGSLAEEGFCRAPHLPTGPAQTNALTRQEGTDAFRMMEEAVGRCCFLYFYARLLELRRLCADFAEPSRVVRGFSPEPGVGISFVETARGTLMQRVRLGEGDVVREAAIVAPTEWNFSPDGAAQQSLSTIKAADYKTWHNRVLLVARQFDACIPVRIEEIPEHA